MRSVCLSLMILIGSTVGAFAQTTYARQIGGKGGGVFDDPCHPGDVMVGYNVTSGKSMNTFAAVCQAVNNGVLVGNTYGLRTWGKTFGGGYHSFFTPRCPTGSAITEIEVWINKFNEVDSIRANCSALKSNVAGTSILQQTGSDGIPVAQDSSECPQGTIAIGIAGRSGALVDSLGLKCSSFPWR